MTKSRIALRLGGALAIALAFLLVLSACSESSKTPDETVEVRLTGKSDGLAAKALTASYDSDELEPSGNLYWTYTAVKADGYFTTGQSSFDDEGNPIEACLNTKPSTDDDGNETTEWTTGLPSALPGKYSVGAWVFTFNAYTSDDMTTDEDEDGVPDSLYYKGEETNVTLSSGGENIVSVTVESVGEGTLVVKGATVAFSTDDYAYYVLLGDVDTPDFSGETSYSQSEIDEGVTISDALSPGYYTVNLYIQGGSYVWKNTLENVPIRANLTTVVSGEFAEEDDSLVTAYISSVGLVTLYSGSLGTLSVTEPVDDDSASATYSLDGYTVTESDGTITAAAENGEGVSYTIALDSDLLTYTAYIEVSDADALAAALAVDGATVTLASDFELTSAISVTNDSVLDLNGHTLEKYSIRLTGESMTMTVKGGGAIVGGSNRVFTITGTDVTLVVEDGSYSTTSGSPLYISGTADVTINGGTFTNSGTSSSYAIRTTKAGSTITVNGGTFSAGSSCLIDSGGSAFVINGGSFTSEYIYLSSTSNGSSLTVNDGDFSFSTHAITDNGYSADITINGGTFTESNSTYSESAVVLQGSGSTATITGGTFNSSTGVLVYKGSSHTVNISGGTFNSSEFALTVNGTLTSSSGITVKISGGEFNNEVYIAGYTTLTISGGTFSGKTQQALHVRAGSLEITGGTFTSGLSSSTAYDYCSYDGDSAALNGDAVIEYCYTGSSGYSAVSAFTISGGEYKNQGICYYIDPASDYTEPTISVSSDCTSAYTAIDPDSLIYKVVVSSSQSVYFTSEDAATSYLESNSGTLYSYDSDNGWVAGAT